ncbi:hypothetical protein [Saccharopolyspora sp. CA-218241]|uniref:hypothetical protein n=1 Tax=Saccharopolyspora sp. CA-218241 TaxID=3240027 RepID=UPI003D990C14
MLPPASAGTFAGYGVDVRVSLGEPAAPDPELPLPGLIAGWLRERAGASSVAAHLLEPAAPADRCARWGADLDRSTGSAPTGLLVLADGTDCRDERSPRPVDDRAAPLDERIGTALAEADAAALRDLDPALAELGVRGRAALQTMPGVVAASGARWHAEPLHSAAPFGIGYHVAVWSRLG